jgi:hypothetical protein
MTELIEMIKKDRWYYEECKSIALEYGSSDELMAYYSTILAYIDSLLARIEKGSK